LRIRSNVGVSPCISLDGPAQPLSQSRWVVLTLSRRHRGSSLFSLGYPGPANLLRISIRFATQVEGPLLSRVTLLRAEGRKIQEPFLEQELWSPDGKVLTS